jgi:hypothetical protein
MPGGLPPYEKKGFGGLPENILKTKIEVLNAFLDNFRLKSLEMK